MFNGCDPTLRATLAGLVDPAKVGDLVTALAAAERSPLQAAMPFADAIEAARFLADVTVGYSRVLTGPDSVGGPIDVAGISRHEGFKWVSRKHYYSVEFNPRGPHDHDH